MESAQLIKHAVATACLCLFVTLVPADEADIGAAIPVTIKGLTELLIYPGREAPATVVAINDTRLSAEIAGRVLSIPVRVGAFVEEGDLVARLDCQGYEIAMSRAQAIRMSAVAKQEFSAARLKNAERLAKKKSIPQEELDQRTLDSRTAQAEVDRTATELRGAEHDVTKCTIRAPFKGVVVERLANVGDYAVVGSPILRLLDQEHIEVSAKVQEQDLASLRNAPAPQFVALGQRYPVVIRVEVPLLRRLTRSYEVRLVFSAAGAPPGAAGRLAWSDSAGHVPSHLLVRRGLVMGVFLAEAGRAQYVEIPGAQEGQPARIDLSPAAKVIVDGRFALEDGDPIKSVGDE